MKKIFLIIALIGFASMSFAQKSYELKFNPKAGEKYDAKVITASKIVQKMMGQEMEIGMDMNIGLLYDIVSVAQNTSINMTYQKLLMNMEMMGQKMQMSSDDEDTNPASKSFKALKGTTISAIISPKGDLIEVKGAEEMVDKLANASNTEKESLKNIVGKDAIKSTIEQSFRYFPDKPVKLGDSWTTIMNLESPYKMTSKNTYTLTKVENGVAYLNVASVISTNGAQKMTSNGMEMTVDLSGDQKGTMEITETTGTLLKSNVLQNLKGKMEVMGQEVPITVTTNANLVMNKK